MLNEVLESSIRKLEESDFPAFAEILIQAYPAGKENTPEFKERFTNSLKEAQNKNKTIEFYGLFRDGKLLGGMRLHSFKLNLFGKIVPVGGVGSVAVDFLHKKEKVAKELIAFFTEHFKAQGASIAMLYPFRPDFYRQMGFGYGTRINQYSVEPASFPNRGSKEGLEVLDAGKAEEVLGCYNRYAKETHGMILRNKGDIEAVLKHPENRAVGVYDGNELKGYLIYSFHSTDAANFLRTNLKVKEMIYESPEALEKFSTFLNTQADQIERIIVNSHDDSLEFLLYDARNGSNRLIPSVFHEICTSGTGLMYKIIDTTKVSDFLKGREFNGIDAEFAFIVRDSFGSDSSLRVPVRLEDGRFAKGVGKSDFVVEIDIADFSSLLVGAVDARRLYRYGNIKLSDDRYLSILEKAFCSAEKPICLTAF